MKEEYKAGAQCAQTVEVLGVSQGVEMLKCNQ